MSSKVLIQKEKMVAALQKKNLLPQKLPENIIFLYQSSVMKKVREKYKTERQPFFIGDLDIVNSNLGVISRLGIGAPSLALFFEKAISLGAKKFISIGTCGSLDPLFKIRDFVIVQKAYCDEGTSLHYNKKTRESAASSSALFSAVSEKAKSNQRQLKPAQAWTTDAFYRETEDRREVFRGLGCSVVDMEASAFYSLAEFHKAEALALFVVSDELSSHDWAPQFSGLNSEIMALFELTVESIHGQIMSSKSK